MFEPLFRGSATAIITPMKNGAVDVPALRSLVNMQVENGTAAIVACGTTGEPSTLSDAERETVIRETVLAADGRIPVVCGTGSNNTLAVIENERRFRDLGCAAQLVVTPYYNKTTQEGIYAHFMHIAENTELPIIAYNVPGRTNLDISPKTLERLAQSGRFIALKESSYDLPSVMEKMSAVEGKMTFYCGNDDMVYPMLALGAEGVISVFSNVAPAFMAKLVKSWFDGDSRQARDMQLQALPLVRALFSEVSPIPCKYAMQLMGLCEGELRLPLIEAGEETKKKLSHALTELGLLNN
ncbi:MAG: 4-hydroxy-tetrahydrodipicolinate synthase [Clostridia bacterium]|nr:4-hydroxy-tetrahydrodipicolinate synthase [Clostridia bacterium]